MAHTAPHTANDQRRFTRPLLALGVVGISLLTACASTPPPREQLAVGRASVERASGPAAAEAPVELSAAREKIERANMAFNNKDYDLARQLAEQADADATLAEAKARSVRSERALTEVRASIKQLREQVATRP